MKADAKSAAFPVDITEYAVNSATSFETVRQPVVDLPLCLRFSKQRAIIIA